MGKDSALYQLMDVRMNGIVESDADYQKILHKSDEYSSRLQMMGLPVDVRLLIDQYISEQNTHLTSYTFTVSIRLLPNSSRFNRLTTV